MLPLILLKILGDLSFYLTFAGFFAVIYGASPSILLVSVMILSVCFTLSFALENKGNLRYAALLPAFLAVLLPGLCPAFVIVLLPAWAYLFLCAKNRTYYPTWSGAIDLVSLFWKVLAPFTLLAIVTRGVDHLVAISFPCAVITFTACIMLARSLRHDIDIYASPAYQAMNMGTAAILVLGTAFVSSEGFRSTAGAAIKGIYQAVIMPVLLGLTQLFAYMMVTAVSIMMKILLFFQVHGDEVPDYETIFGNPTDDALYAEYNPNAHPWLKFAAGAILLLAALYGAMLVFKKLQGTGTRKQPESTGEKETRSYVFGRQAKDREESSGLAEKLRAQYRKFLKLYLKHNFPLEKYFTSESIMTVSSNAFDQDASAKLRQLYIKARYAGRAEKEDVALAKELVKQLKKDTDMLPK